MGGPRSAPEVLPPELLIERSDVGRRTSARAESQRAVPGRDGVLHSRIEPSRNRLGSTARCMGSRKTPEASQVGQYRMLQAREDRASLRPTSKRQVVCSISTGVATACDPARSRPVNRLASRSTAMTRRSADRRCCLSPSARPGRRLVEGPRA